MTDRATLTAQDEFHAHLDQCAQCRNRPLNLCPVGVHLLWRVGQVETQADERMWR